jgi:hypothetical protein
MTDRRLLAGTLALLLLSVMGAASECSIATDTGSFELRISGTVRLLDGCWQLESVNGRRYELLPDQAPHELLRDGASVLVTGQTPVQSETGCDVGQPLMIRRVLSVSGSSG